MGALCFAALWEAWKICGEIGRDNSFSRQNVRSLRRISKEMAAACALMAAGFANIHDDMDTEFWLVKADRSMPEMALLKSMYTKEQRKALAEYLHRIEYDVDAARQSRDFWAFYEEAGLFPDYVASFVKQAVFHPSWFFRRLRMESGEECETVLAILASMRENASDSAEIRWIDERIDTLRAAGGNG